MLRCEGTKIVDSEGQEVILRGTCLGAYLLQENFTNGFPGHEKAYRKAMLEAIGQEKYDFFWSKFYEYFYADADAKWFSSLGMNLQRLAINYRHLNDDLNPSVIKESGFALIDRIVEINGRHGIYTILDLHAAPGGQNFDWHSDNNLPDALLWEHKEFQDRTIRIWEAIAARYRGNEWVAGYNLLNEPTDDSPGAKRLLAFYHRLATAVRAVDPTHILCFDGNTFGADFRDFEKAGFTLENAIYSIHDYSPYGFPNGPIWQGSETDRAKLRKDYERKADYSKKTKTPIWNGEFGCVQATADIDGDDWRQINADRNQMLSEQLKMYKADGISWSLWLYKDVGVQGIVHAAENSKWNTLFGERIRHKTKHALDFWGTDDTETRKHFEPMMNFIREEFPQALPSYPPWWQLKQHCYRRTLYSWIADRMCPHFVEPMQNLSFEELDELAASFKLENCVPREEVINVLKENL